MALMVQNDDVLDLQLPAYYTTIYLDLFVRYYVCWSLMEIGSIVTNYCLSTGEYAMLGFAFLSASVANIVASTPPHMLLTG